MKPPMLQTAHKVTTTRNAYGDYVASGSVALPCKFRYITDIQTTTANETVNADAMAWFESDSGVEKNDIFQIDGEHWRVERLIKARRLRSNAVQFIKVELLRYGVIS